MLSRSQIERLKERYPVDTEIELIHMKGEDRMPPGLRGKVFAVDDIGQIHVAWENGSSLALNTDEDQFRMIKKEDPVQKEGSHDGEDQQVGMNMGMS